MIHRYKSKTIIFILVVVFSLSVLSGCGKSTASRAYTEGNVNSTYEEGMDLTTVSGNKIAGDNPQIVPYPELGFAQLFPEAWGDLHDLNLVMVNQGICITFMPPSLLPNFDEMSQEEIDNTDFRELLSNQINIIKTFYVSSDTSEEKVKEENANYQVVKKLAVLGENAYYIAYNDSLSQESFPLLTPEDIKVFDTYAREISDFSDNIMVFPIQENEVPEEGITSEQIRSLTGKDLDGNAIDSTVFQKYDLTMVNIWATWCGPCVEELPDLGNLYRNLPDGVNLITICADGSEQLEAAKEILKECNAEFVTICGDQNIQDNVLSNVYSYPTTIFVDKNGDLVGEPLLGAWSEKEYSNEINNRLNK